MNGPNETERMDLKTQKYGGRKKKTIVIKCLRTNGVGWEGFRGGA